MYLLDGMDIIVVRSPSPEHTRAIEIALKGIVSEGLQLSDIKAFTIGLVNKIAGLELESDTFSDDPPW